MVETLMYGSVIGVGATLAMDVWAIIQNRIWKLPLPNWAMPGRWFVHLFKGTVCHKDIGQSAEVEGELILGWLFHYGVGVLYGIVFLLLVGTNWIESPNLFPAWIFAIATIAAGWFILQPGMGLGWAANKTPSPWISRGLGLVAHTVFGVGMWASGLLIG